MEERPLDEIPPTLPGDKVLRRWRPPRRRLRLAPSIPGIFRFLGVVIAETPFLKMVCLLIVLWLGFSAGVYFAERGAEGTAIHSYGSALYWGIAAFSTAGIADAPLSNTAQIVGGIWIVVGSMVFFGAIVATVTAYFALPRQRPTRQLINTIQYNLGELDNLSLEELDVLKEVTVRVIDSRADRLRKGSSGP